MKAFLTSYAFLVVVLLAICVDHLVDAILAHNYTKIVIYGVLSVAVFIAFLILVL